jgi:hypothetical protein
MVLNKIQKVKVRSRPVIDYNKVMIKSQKGAGQTTSRERDIRDMPLTNLTEDQLRRYITRLIRESNTALSISNQLRGRRREQELSYYQSIIEELDRANAEWNRRNPQQQRPDIPIFSSEEVINPRIVINPDNDLQVAFDEDMPRRLIQRGQGNGSVKERVIQRPDIIKLPVVRGGALRPDQFGIEGLRTYFLPQVRELASQTEDLKQEFLSTRDNSVREMILRQVQIINRTLQDLQRAMNEFIENRPELGSESLLPTTSFMDNPENVIDDIQDVIDEIADNYNEMTQINQQQGFGLIQQGQGIFDFAGMVIDKLTPRKVKEKMFDALIGNTIKRITNPKTSYR